ncbi:hypothetical protein FHX75_121568 [Micromonospora palomenae]|uniref:Uncharacterized protein n=1 Tax=Micromonospora palomenae TaxID=1461247 RepID=A0A561WGM5_9ACTN|nr:hypothetical protein [Micromonospora palomenae]TWG23022.1 hypothetical protein FHX75_121568 [Micromonospora palomenae]
MSGDERIGGPAGANGARPASQVGPALGQAVVVGAVGLAALPMVLFFWLLVPSYPQALLLGAAVLLVELFGLGTAMRQGSALTATLGRRVGWTLLVATGGIALGGYCLARLPDLLPGLGGSMSMFLLPALGLALVSAALTRPRVVRLPAVALIVLLVSGMALATVDRRADELAQRLDHAGVEADLVFVTALPGYSEAGQRAVTPTNKFAVTYSPVDGSGGRIIVWATRGGMPDCLPEPPGGYPDGYPLHCVREAPERSYQAIPPDLHEYLASRGDRVVHVRATRDVDRETLRVAVDNVRQATPDDLEQLLPRLPLHLRR